MVQVQKETPGRGSHTCSNKAGSYYLPHQCTHVNRLKGRYKTKAVHDKLPFSKLASLNEALEVGQRDPKTRF